jgi:hypothetical protein
MMADTETTLTIQEIQGDLTGSDIFEGRPVTAGPLSSLFGNPSGFTALQYPDDVGKGKFGHIVKFFINQLTNSTFGSQSTFDADTTGEPNAQAKLASFESVTMSASRRRLGGTISLYMPDTVNMSYTAGYQEDNQSDYIIPYYGSLAKNAYDFYEKSGNVSDGAGIQSFFSGGTTGGKNAIVPSIIAGLRDVINKTGLINADVLLESQGYAINPQIQLLFKAVGLREFQMEFMFSPKNEGESKSVASIIRTFKYHAAPEVGGTDAAGGGRSTGLFFKVPSTFNIQFENNGIENNYIHKIGECVLQNISVDYAPNGWSAFDKTFAPVQTRLTLQFKEVDIVDKNKVLLGF